MTLFFSCLSVIRRRVFNHICGQAEAQPGAAAALRGRRKPERQPERQHFRDGDPGGAPSASCLLLHRQGEHPAPPAPPPDRVLRHTGTWRSRRSSGAGVSGCCSSASGSASILRKAAHSIKHQGGVFSVLGQIHGIFLKKKIAAKVCFSLLSFA